MFESGNKYLKCGTHKRSSLSLFNDQTEWMAKTTHSMLDLTYISSMEFCYALLQHTYRNIVVLLLFIDFVGRHILDRSKADKNHHWKASQVSSGARKPEYGTKTSNSGLKSSDKQRNRTAISSLHSSGLVCDRRKGVFLYGNHIGIVSVRRLRASIPRPTNFIGTSVCVQVGGQWPDPLTHTWTSVENEDAPDPQVGKQLLLLTTHF